MPPLTHPQDFDAAVLRSCDCRADFAVVTVVCVEGSTPCGVGAKAIVDADGRILGTVGGGPVEAQAQQAAVQAIQQKRPRLLDVALEGAAVAGGEPICGGRMRLLVDPWSPNRRRVYEAMAAARQQRARGALVTTITGDTEYRVDVQFLAEQQSRPKPICRMPTRCGPPSRSEKPQWLVRTPPEQSPRVEVLIDPVTPAPLLVIAGGGHVGQALAIQADLVGFDILVIDDRPEFTAAELFPGGVAKRCGPIAEEIGRLAIAPDTYVVIVTRGHRHDAEALAACLHKPAAYIGMIGSRRKVSLMRAEFINSGLATAEEFDRVYAPIGLDIGALTVPEIAASITAELIAVRRKAASRRTTGQARL